jgi:Tfp pilus assembly protein PilF
MQDVENLFLEVSRAIEEHDISAAKEFLDEILLIDPGYGRAHNHLGWIYETKIKDFKKAKRHYELAIKFCKGDYPIVYINYGYLLIEYGQYEEAEKIIKEGLETKGTDKASLFYQYGKIAEHRQDFLLAYQNYQHSFKLNFNKEFQRLIENEIERVKSKMNRWQRIRLRLSL